MTIEELLEIAEATGDWEKLARVLLAKRKPKKAKTQDVYAWGLAEFSDGVRIVVGGYGLKDEKIILQKAQRRRALVMSGRWFDAAVLAATAPPVRGLAC